MVKHSCNFSYMLVLSNGHTLLDEAWVLIETFEQLHCLLTIFQDFVLPVIIDLDVKYKTRFSRNFPFRYRVLDLSSGLEDIGAIKWNFILYIFIWRLLVVLCMIKSIKSIEKVWVSYYNKFTSRSFYSTFFFC